MKLLVRRPARIIPPSLPRRLALDLSPSLVLAMWAAGVSLSAAVAVWWKVVGPGFVWLSSGVVLVLGVPAAAADSHPAPWVGCALALGACSVARARGAATSMIAGAAAAFEFTAVSHGPVLGALTGSLLLGAVTGEMILGHWFLVDPRLPRWALRRLSLAGGLGAAADLAVLASLGVFPWAEGDLMVGISLIAASVGTAALMAMVWVSLGEEGYSGVMAATGLSYLATLTAIAAAVVGRLLLDGPLLA